MKRMRFLQLPLITLSFFFSLSASAAGEKIVVRVPAFNEREVWSKHARELLDVVFEKTKDMGEHSFVPVTKEMKQDRALQSLRDGKDIDIFWTMTSAEREKGLAPIRIPLMKGLLGFRVFIIRKGDDALFKDVNSLEDLKKIRLGQGTDWPDTKILEAAGLNVVKNMEYDKLFEMLTLKRFDAFPRGVNEPWAEVEQRAAMNLDIEKTISVVYPAPAYFFVNPKNKALYDRVEKGLKIAKQDGSYDALFRKNFQTYIDKADFKKRKIFRIPNPLLSKETPVDDASLWFDPAKGQ